MMHGQKNIKLRRS